MIRTVYQRNLYVNHRVAPQSATHHSILNSLINRVNVFLRNDAAHDLINKFIAFSAFLRLHFNHAVTVLSASAGLSDKFAFLAERCAASRTG